MHDNPFPEVFGLKCFTHAFKSSNFLRQRRCMTTGHGYGRANESALRNFSARMSMLPLTDFNIPWNLHLPVRVSPVG